MLKEVDRRRLHPPLVAKAPVNHPQNRHQDPQDPRVRR